jgi:hypothetical protein
MNHNLDINSINRVIYSKIYIDWYIEKVMSNRTYSKSYKCDEILKTLRTFLGRASGLSGFGKEIAYINENIMKYEKAKVLYQEMDSSLDRNIDDLIGLDPNSIKKLNKEALAVMMISLLGQIKDLKTTVDQFVDQNIDLKAQLQDAKQQKVTEKIKEESNVQVVVHDDINNGMDRLEVQDGKVKVKLDSEPIKTGAMPSLLPENSLRYLRNHGVIPSNIDENEIIKYCNDVLGFSPKLVDYKSVLTVNQINLLNRSNLVANSKIKTGVTKSHNSVISGYEDLIKNYESMLESMEGKKEFEEESKKVRGALESLRSQAASYKQTVSKFGVQDVEQYLNFGISNNSSISRNVSGVSKKVVESQNKKLTELDEEIATLSKNKERLEAHELKFGLGKMKQVVDTKILSKRIVALKRKQGRMKNRQSKIINASTELYKMRMEREFSKYSKKQEGLRESIANKGYQLEKQRLKEERLNKLKLKIQDAEKKKKSSIIVDRVEFTTKETMYKTREKQLEESLKRLKSKNGKVNIVEQYSSTLNNELSYAL